MINLESPVPRAILEDLSGPRAVMNHVVNVNSDRWQKVLSDRGLPVPEDKLASGGRIMISRAEVFKLGQQVPSRAASFQLLYHALAWGLGLPASWLHLRLDGLAEDPDRAAAKLEEAWLATHAGRSPSEVYTILTTERGSGRIKQFGPAFATKFMYFAQGPTVMPNLLILDSVVAGKLRGEIWPDARADAWAPSTYEAYCQLLERWAVQATSLLGAGTPVRADQIEYTLFKTKP